MSAQHILWYFADPMCSWCYGFAPVINAIEDTYKDRLQLRLMLGGLRPGTRDPLPPTMREEILHHWHEVHKRSGQPFAFDGAMPEGFVYDTEIPSRAVVVVGELHPSAMLPYFHSVQQAFYAEQKDVTDPATLAALAQPHDVEPTEFQSRFHSEDTKKKTHQHFHQTRQAHIDGFPTVALQHDSDVQLLTVGYRPFEELKPGIENWLNEKH
jgi:putative protein-disulfide isomerase